MQRKQTTFILLVTLFVLVSLVAGVLVSSQQRPVSPKLKAANEKIKVFFLPITNTTVSKTFDIRITIDTQGQSIENIKLVLGFDSPVEFNLQQSTWGSLIKPKNNSGFFFDKAASKLTLEGTGDFSGSGNFATINIKALNPGKVNVSVFPESEANGASFEENSAFYLVRD